METKNGRKFIQIKRERERINRELKNDVIVRPSKTKTTDLDDLSLSSCTPTKGLTREKGEHNETKKKNKKKTKKKQQKQSKT